LVQSFPREREKNVARPVCKVTPSDSSFIHATIKTRPLR